MIVNKQLENDEIKSSMNVDIIDPNLNLPNPANNIFVQPLNLRDNIYGASKIKKLSLEFLREIEHSNISDEEKEKFNILKDKVEKGKYFYIYDDLNGNNNLNISTFFEENEYIMENPIIVNLPEEINYDVEFIKLGRKCKGVKNRYAIIKRGKLASSKNPRIKAEIKKLKDKTNYLQNSEVKREIFDPHQELQGEWHAKSKPYRIRINYIIDPNDIKKKRSSFYLYFNNKKEETEVYYMIFGLSLKTEKKMEINRYINTFEGIIKGGNKVYTILKILSVKNKIKKRKILYNKIESSIKGKLFGKLNWDKNKLKELSAKRKQKKQSEEPILRGRKPKDEFQKQISDFMPLISNVSSLCGEKSYKHSAFRRNKKSLNDLINKYSSLKEEIPRDIVENNNDLELTDSDTCFSIPNGVQIEKDSEIKGFNLDPDLCNNAKFIYFNKKSPEIIFKNDNDGEIEDENIDNNLNKLSGDNIYEISNIILNSNIDINGQEKNNLIICGPKKDNNLGIAYDCQNNHYLDPENLSIKCKTYNEHNNAKIIGKIIHIYQSELDINDEKMRDLLVSITGSTNPFDDFMENFLFGYKILLSDIKSMESLYLFPKYYNKGIAFIEFNHQYFIPKEYENSNLIIEVYCIPVPYFSNKNITEENRGYIGKLLSPIKLGYVKITNDDIKERKYKYSILNQDIPLPNSYLLIDGMDDSFDSIKLKNKIKGKDFAIGSDSYIEQIINKQFIEKVNNNPEISDDIKEKYFNIKFEGNNLLFRPNEDMDKEEFKNDICSDLSEETYANIKSNEKYNYLPFCEKYEKDIFLKSNNLKSLTDKQKDYIQQNYNIGDWIYKAPEIKAKFLSKNIGCSNEGISEFIYCTQEKKDLPFETLSDQSDMRVIPMCQNSFNILDLEEIDEIENVDNFQWKTGIKFNNPMQMHSFLKLLVLARQNVNTQENNKIENKVNEFDPDKIFDFEKKRNKKDNSGVGNYEINISFIDFISKVQLKFDPTFLRVYLLIEGNENQDEEENRPICSFFEDSKYDFKNSLIDNNEKIKKSIIKSANDSNQLSFPTKIKLEKKIFNEKKCIALRDQMKREINLKQNIEKFKISIIESDKAEKYKNEYYSIVELSKFKENVDKILCNKIELPLYKKEDKNEDKKLETKENKNLDKNEDINKDKIYGCIGIDLYEINPGKNFEEQFEEVYKQYLQNPLMVLKDQIRSNTNFQTEDYHFGLYEPNVYRRKILNSIHNIDYIEVDPYDLENCTHGDLDILYEKLARKNCLALPERPYFSSFNFYNSKKDFENYKNKLGKKLLKYKRHEEFMKIFRQKEWDNYLIDKKKDNQITIDEYLDNLPDKKEFIENEDDLTTFYNLIYVGIPSKNFRNKIYNWLLDTKQLYEKTRTILKEKEDVDLNGEKIIFNHFENQLNNKNDETNLIFSLIDNDSTFLCSLANTTLDDINEIKKIAKSFFIWAKYNIGLDGNDKYVYFIGLLSIIQKLRKYFEENYIVFWLLIGLSQYIDHFHQQNPLFTDKMNYINLYGLICKLILESHQKEIFNKFISLNFPTEFFLAQHLSSLYSDFFNEELMMRIFDILILECSFKNINNDKLQYLRILCAIPITLMELNKKRILACESVSEIESIFNDLILRALNHNEFIILLRKNVTKFYVYSNIFERWVWFLNNKGREWDSKREDLENLISEHFKPVYNENINYLNEINKLLKSDAQEMFNNYSDNLNNKLKLLKSVYYQQESLYDDLEMKTGILVHVSKLQQIYNNQNKNINEYNLNLSFRKDDLENGNYPTLKEEIKFDSENNKILNKQDLFFKVHFEKYNVPRYMIFELGDTNGNKVATFIYQILNFEPMKISKIILENIEPTEKYYLEFAIFKSINKKLGDNMDLYNIIFSPPEYIHSKSIEEKLYNFSLSNNYYKKKINKLIKNENNHKNELLNYNTFDDNLMKVYKQLNNNIEIEDKYNYNNYKNSDRIIQKKVNDILNLFVQEEIKKYINDWLTETYISIEEILYSLTIIDKSLNSINEKLYLLYSIAQTKDRLLFNNEKLSINKLKEMIYSLYKRFMIYFTKSDVERMIDFLFKDERLFSIKHAFIYNITDSNKINDFIFDKDKYEPKLDNKKSFEIYFDDIGKQLNLFLNHLNNHYNKNSISDEMIKFILKDLLKNNINLNKYIKNGFNTITLVIEKDNIIYKRNYDIGYSPLNVEEENDSPFLINQKNENEIVDKQLCYEIAHLETYNNYSINNYISFDKFKEIFFKLPYLSDLFRVSFSYVNENNNLLKKEFDFLELSFEFEEFISIDEYKVKNTYININNKKNKYGIFYFPNKGQDLENNEYNMDVKINITDTIDNIVNLIIEKFKNKINVNRNEKFLMEQLKSINKINCYVYYDSDYNTKNKRKIGYFDRLNSCVEIKNKTSIEIKLILNPDSFSYTAKNSIRVLERRNGYCKIFYSNYNDFIWKKCKIKTNNKNNVKLTCKDFESKPNVINDDVVFAFNL